MTKELVYLLEETEVDDYKNFNQIPKDLTGVLLSLKALYSEEDVDALANWQLEDISDMNLLNWTVELKGLLEEVSGEEINSLDSMCSLYIKTYGRRVTNLINMVETKLDGDKVDVSGDLMYVMDTISNIIRDILPEKNTDKTVEELTTIVYSKITI
jgi:hypothetical protein